MKKRNSKNIRTKEKIRMRLNLKNSPTKVYINENNYIKAIYNSIKIE